MHKVLPIHPLAMQQPTCSTAAFCVHQLNIEFLTLRNKKIAYYSRQRARILDSLADDHPDEDDKQKCIDNLRSNFASSFEELASKRKHLQSAHDYPNNEDSKRDAQRLLLETDAEVASLESELWNFAQKYGFTNGSYQHSFDNGLRASFSEQFWNIAPQIEPTLPSSFVHVNGEDFNRWDQFRAVLDSASSHILAVVEKSIKLLHDSILRLHGLVVRNSKIGMEFWQTFDGHFPEGWNVVSENHLRFFAFECLMCHSSLERENLKDDKFDCFQHSVSRLSLPWSNSNMALWHDCNSGPVEMAKLYCRPLGPRAQAILKFSDLDMLSLLRIMLRCSFFCLPLRTSTGSLSLEHLFVDECVVKRTTARACLRAMKSWSAFESKNSHFSEGDFLHASISFDDLVTQIERCYISLPARVDMYVKTTFWSRDYFSRVSSSMRAELVIPESQFLLESSMSSSSEFLHQHHE